MLTFGIYVAWLVSLGCRAYCGRHYKHAHAEGYELSVCLIGTIFLPIVGIICGIF